MPTPVCLVDNLFHFTLSLIDTQLYKTTKTLILQGTIIILP